MCKYSISLVAPVFVDIIWDKVAPHIQRVVDVSHGELTMETVKKELLAANTLLVTIADGDTIIAVHTFEVRVLDSGLRVLYIPITGGSKLFEWKDEVFKLAIDVARRFNCTEIRGVSVRDGWMDILGPMGWEPVHQVIKYNIGEQ